MRVKYLRSSILLFTISTTAIAPSQSPPPQNQAPAPPASTLAQKPGGPAISLDDAIRLALQHNHNLLAARTTIQQNQAEEITANLRPDPVLLGDAIFLPVFEPSNLTADYIDNTGQFDLGVSYLFERGKKRQHRLQAAKRPNRRFARRRSTTPSAPSRTVSPRSSSTSNWPNPPSPWPSRTSRAFSRPWTSPRPATTPAKSALDDLLKIKLQLLQFQTDVNQAQLARVQGLSDLRQLLGYESVSAGYDVAGIFEYQP